MEPLSIVSFVNAIDDKNINEVEKLSNNIYKNNKNIDVVFNIYNNYSLSFERLQFIMENCTKYLNISSKLIKQLMKDDKSTLLDFIFDNFKFYDIMKL